MSFLYMEFSWEEDQYLVEKRESIIPLIDETRNRGGPGGVTDMMMMGRNGNENGNASGNDNQFWPIEHPIEPLDGDRPVKCPIPNSSSLINDGSTHKEQFSDSLRKRAAEQVSNKEPPRLVVAAAAAAAAEPSPVRALRKRHHTLTRSVDHAIKPLLRIPPLYHYPPRNLTISDMLHHFDDKFES